jgi:hypothetical protein
MIPVKQSDELRGNRAHLEASCIACLRVNAGPARLRLRNRSLAPVEKRNTVGVSRWADRARHRLVVAARSRFRRALGPPLPAGGDAGAAHEA